MHCTRPLARTKNLLLAFDAFDTLYRPTIPVTLAYTSVAQKHGIDCVGDAACLQKPLEQWKEKDYEPVQKAFRQAFKAESANNPNYGRATGLGADRWWANVIHRTFQPFLKPQQKVPQALISELLTRYASKEGYTMFSDVRPFFNMLRRGRNTSQLASPWNWEKTVVGVLTNSDDRVPLVLSSMGLTVGHRRFGTSAQHSLESSEDDISFVVMSYDVGHEKPDRRIFDAATQLLKEMLAENELKSDTQSMDDYEKLYVGDSVEKDYVGAERAGWNAVIVDRQYEQRELEKKSGPDDLRGSLSKKTFNLANGETKEVRVADGLRGLTVWQPEVSTD